MSLPDVQIATRPRTRAYTDIPGELRHHFEEHGQRPSWQLIEQLPMLYQEGIEAVHVEALPAEIRAVLSRIRMPHNADGLFVRGTVALCTQSLAAYEAAQAEYEAMALTRHQRRDVDELDAQVSSMLGIEGRPGPGIYRTPNIAPGDFVRHVPAPPPDDSKE